MPRKNKRRAIKAAQDTTEKIAATPASSTDRKAVAIACPKPRAKPRPTYTIHGTIRGVDGLPLGGVTVTLSGAANGQAVTPNSTGIYSFGPYPGGGRYKVEVAKAPLQFTPASATSEALNADATHDFTVASTVIRVHVRPAGKNPDPLFRAVLQDATFSLDGDAEHGPITLGSGGELAFPPVPRGGSYTVFAPGGDPAFSTCRSLAVTADRPNKHANFDVPCFKISGSIKRLGMLIRANEAEATVASSQGSATARVTVNDGNGEFAFPALPAGRDYVVSAQLDPFTLNPLQHVVQSLSRDEKPGYGLKMAKLTGTCMNRGSPLPGATLTLSGAVHDLTQQSRDAVRGKVDAGSYEFAAVPVGGDYVLTASHKSFKFTPDRLTLSALKDSLTELDFDTNRHRVTLILDGFDKEDLRDPLASANKPGRVMVKMTGMPAIEVLVPVGHNIRTQAEFAALPAGRNYSVTFTAPAYYTITTQDPITALTGLSQDLTLRYTAVRAPLTLTGTVRNGGAPVDNLEVRLHDSNDKVITSTFTDPRGQYTLTDVKGGSNVYVQPDRLDLATSEPWHRKFDFLDTNLSGLDFDFTGAIWPDRGGPYLAVSAVRRLYLAPEAQENLRGDRGPSHEVPVHLLIQAVNAKWNVQGTIEEVWKHVHSWRIPGPRDPSLDWQTGFSIIKFLVGWNEDGSRTLVTAYFVPA